MGEARDRFEAMRTALSERAVKDQERIELAKNTKKAMYDLANDLTYPVDADGNVMDVSFMIPFLSFHLARCGYRKHEDQATIKQIPHPQAGGPQIADNAVLYVPVDATGQLPEAFKKPLEVPPEARENLQGWRVKTHITVDGETIKGGK